MTLDYSGVDNSIPGVYSYNVTCNGGACGPDVATAEVTVISTPTPGAPDVTMCTGYTQADLEAAVAAGGGGCGLDTTTITDNGDGTYTVTCDNQGCVAEATGKVTVLPAPTADFTVDKTTGCAPLTVDFTDLSTGNPTSWSWSFPGGSPSSHTGQTPPSVTYNSPGTYTVSLTVSNDCGSDTETEPNYIEVIACDGNPVIISVTQSSDEPCADEDVVITAHVTDDVGVTSVTLEYDTTEVPMSLDSGTPQNGYWVATIPGQPAETTLTIYVIAYDGAGNSAQYGPHYKTWIECAPPVPTTLVLLPETGENPVDTTHDLTATVYDQYGSLMEGVDLTWSIESGPGSFVSQETTTDANGEADAVITSSESGTSTVRCEVAGDASVYDTAIKMWTAGVTPSGGGGGGCPEIKYLTVDWEGNNTTKPLYSNGKLAADLLGPNSDLSHSLLLERGTHAPLAGGRTYYLIVVRELEETEIPSLTENTVAIVVFNITPVGAVFDRDIFLTLGIDELPENALNVTMAYYDDVNEVWETLEFEAGGPSGVAELTLSTAINHFSIFGVLAEVAPPPPPPAHFEASGLSIVPGVEKIWQRITFVTRTGQSVIITANGANDGGQEGDCTVALKLNGETVDTKTVTIGTGQSQPVSFTASGLDYGQYDVEVNELSGEFTASRTINWWLIIVIIVAIGLIIWGVVWGRRRRRRAQQEA
jgi:PKD repeat protein